MPDVSVVVPARDADRTLGRTLAALADQEGELEYEVIVVDDGSRDHTADIARAAGPPVVLIDQPPAGPAAARDRGVSHSSAPLLAFCDADVFPTRGWLKAGIEALAEADIVQGKVLPDPAATVGAFDRTIWIASQVGLWEAANLFVRRDVFNRAGGFREVIRPRTGKPLAEDVWLGYRALAAGARPAFAPAALAYHAVFPRTWIAYAAERRRLWHFPAIARTAPQLRVSFFYRQVFLDRRTARFDAAALAAALAWASRSPWPLLGAVPYLRLLRAHARRGLPAAPRPFAVGAADLVADAIGLAAMMAGSLRYRSLVL